MRGQIVILALLLAMASPALAAYPEDYYGPPIPSGCMEVEAYIPDGWYLDRNPWSSPSPEESIFWFGMLCVEGDIAVLEFTSLGSRSCYEQLWGSDICYAGWSIELNIPDRHVLPWDPDFQVDWGFYIASIFMGGWQWSYESLTDLGDGSFMFVTGVFDFITPLWFVESDDYTRWKLLVSPRTAKAFPVRRIGGRF
jgi:hypothetical protein